MNLNKSTRYGLYAAMELAREESGAPVAVGRVAQRYGIPDKGMKASLEPFDRR